MLAHHRPAVPRGQASTDPPGYSCSIQRRLFYVHPHFHMQAYTCHTRSLYRQDGQNASGNRTASIGPIGELSLGGLRATRGVTRPVGAGVSRQSRRQAWCLIGSTANQNGRRSEPCWLDDCARPARNERRQRQRWTQRTGNVGGPGGLRPSPVISSGEMNRASLVVCSHGKRCFLAVGAGIAGTSNCSALATEPLPVKNRALGRPTSKQRIL